MRMIDCVEIFDRFVLVLEHTAIEFERIVGIIGRIRFVVKEIAGLVVALHGDDTATRREMARDDGTKRVEPSLHIFVEFFARV